jgi:hypothetical protein
MASRGTGKSDVDTAGILFGAATGVSFFAALLSNARVAKALEVRAIPLWVTIVCGVVLLVAAIVWSLRAATPMPILMLLVATPMLVSATVVRLEEPNPSWAVHLRAVGLGLVIAFTLATSLMYAQRKRELERAVFFEGTTLAFFVTVVATAAYGVIETGFHVPHLSVVWVPIFGGFCWEACLSIVSRRYS